MASFVEDVLEHLGGQLHQLALDLLAPFLDVLRVLDHLELACLDLVVLLLKLLKILLFVIFRLYSQLVILLSRSCHVSFPDILVCLFESLSLTSGNTL